MEAGQVQSHVFENAGHSLPFTNVEELADQVSGRECEKKDGRGRFLAGLLKLKV